jgi:hypothetical protein
MATTAAAEVSRPSRNCQSARISSSEKTISGMPTKCVPLLRQSRWTEA